MTKTKKQSQNKKKEKEKGKPSKYSVDEYVERAEHYLANFQPELAIKFLRKALETDKNNTDVMDMLGEILAENGAGDEAKQILTQSISISPNSGHSKYLSLAQLTEFPGNVQLIQKGIEILSSEKAKLEPFASSQNDDLKRVIASICSAYCSIVEIYMSDGCDEPNAESECVRNVEAALKVDPSSVESLCTLASLRLTQTRRDDAKVALARAVEIVNNFPEDDDFYPPFEIRRSLAKILLECEKFEDADDIIDTLLMEKEDNSELWFLSAIACAGQNNPVAAMDCLKQSKKLAEQANLEPEIMEMINEKIEEVSKMPIPEGMDDDEEEEEENGNEGDEDEESEDEMDN
eukprot:c15309_g1_i1.p1 GENE.c15309_g1_i1~~c15309_g1_i1.p1  ORF type:complete len:356 (-),score=163.48 c15309_g1_i1:30-1073(-)